MWNGFGQGISWRFDGDLEYLIGFVDTYRSFEVVFIGRFK